MLGVGYWEADFSAPKSDTGGPKYQAGEEARSTPGGSWRLHSRLPKREQSGDSRQRNRRCGLVWCNRHPANWSAVFQFGYNKQMKRATLTETKNNLSALVDQVRQGESILILDRGRPVARLESVLGGEADPEGRLARLERQGLIRRGRTRSLDALLQQPPPRPAAGASALRELLDERRGGR